MQNAVKDLGSKKYLAVSVADGVIYKVSFEARSLGDAQRLAALWGFGLEGELADEPRPPTGRGVVPEAFDVESTCRILGGISRVTLYRLLKRGKLQRLPDTRKVLVTRHSIERYCSAAA